MTYMKNKRVDYRRGFWDGIGYVLILEIGIAVVFTAGILVGM